MNLKRSAALKNAKWVPVILLFTLWSCNNPLDRPYNQATLAQDVSAIGKNADSTYTQLLYATIVRFKFESKRLDGLTYRQLMREGKRYREANRRALERHGENR
jgi:hypothetical protein